MKKENYNINSNNKNLIDDLLINISSNSSKNHSSKNSSNNYKMSLTQNNNSSSNSKNNDQNFSLFNIIKQKLSNNNNNEEKSSELLYSLGDNSSNKFGYDISFKNNSNKYSSKSLSLSEDKKEKSSKIKMIKSNITPEKKPDYNAEFFKKSKNKNRAVLETKNINGKNLMDEFKDISVNVTTEENNKNRLSFAENISDKTLTLKNNFINKNKSENTNKINDIKLPENQIKNDNIIFQNNISKMNNKKEKQIIPKDNNLASFSGKNAKRSTSNLKKSSLQNFQNFFNKNNIDFENLINKYMPKKINNNNNHIGFMNYQKIFGKKNNNNNINKINTEKKVNSIKTKNTPKSDSYKRKLSSSYVKIRESVLKNLFHDNKPKPNEDININTLPLPNKLSAKVMKENKQIITSNIFNKGKNNKNKFIKAKSIKKESIDNKNNIKKINIDNNSYFFKLKDKKEMTKQYDKPINKGFNYKNKNE